MEIILLSGMALGLSIAAPMGPVNIAAIRRGLGSGFQAAFLFGLGANLADVIYASLILIGLAPLLEASATGVVRLAMWIISGAFLIYLGISGIQLRKVVGVGTNPDARAEMHPLLAGLGITLFNPTSIFFWLAIGSAFFSTMALAQQTGGNLFFVAGVFLGSFGWTVTLALALHFARRLVNQRVLRVVSLSASLALIIFGFSLFAQAAQAILF